MDWYPTLPFGEGPRYVQIVAALHNDIMNGRVAPGQRLPTHREMASALNLSVGTVSKAYALAERRGLISGQVGRGTFVQRPKAEFGVYDPVTAETARVNLALNAPPDTGEADALATVLAEIAADPDLKDILGYLPHQGIRRHRKAIADWFRRHGSTTEESNLYVTSGAQHAISIALRLLAQPGDRILVENLTYSGLAALSLMEGYALHGVQMDEDGIVPASLDAAFAQTGAKVLFCTPSFQTATGSIMPEARRREIAEIVQRHDGWIVEDDVYAFLMPEPEPPLCSYLPERSFHVMSFSKCLAPGLRVGAMTAPPEFRDRVVNAIRSTGWMANAVMTEAVVRLLASGAMDRQAQLKRAAAAERTLVAQEILGDLLFPKALPCFHTWLIMPAGRTASNFVAQAALQGITLAAPSPISSGAGLTGGIRICLGAANNTESLRRALLALSDILNDVEEMALV